MYDVAVLGAGAAGLVAAAQLSRAGCSIALLEARDRIGGRIHTLSDPSLPAPVELGAEFIHGRAPTTFALLREAGIPALDTSGNRFTVGEEGLEPREGVFAQVRELMQRACALDTDVSVEAFLERYADDEEFAEARAAALMMVEGFDAADPRRASVRAVAQEWSGGGLGGQCRPAGGYGALMAHLLSCLDGTRSMLKLETRVQGLNWGGDSVKVGAATPTGALLVTARRAIITLPPSLLEAPASAPGAVRFEPALELKRAALRGVALGPVLKVVMRFRTAFWEQLDEGRYYDAGFLHARHAQFPTLWTALPARVPLLTAWMGGPRVQRFAGADRARVITAAVASVCATFGTGADVSRELVAAYVHDWQSDPHSQGAYSYVTVGGEDAAAALAAPLADKLFFAGEATCTEEMGTVEAALQSGTRAARQALLSLQRA
jgi:monoamine oxidase